MINILPGGSRVVLDVTPHHSWWQTHPDFVAVRQNAIREIWKTSKLIRGVSCDFDRLEVSLYIPTGGIDVIAEYNKIRAAMRGFI